MLVFHQVTDDPADTMFVHPEAGALILVNPEPSPVNAVATIDPLILRLSNNT